MGAGLFLEDEKSKVKKFRESFLSPCNVIHDYWNSFHNHHRKCVKELFFDDEEKETEYFTESHFIWKQISDIFSEAYYGKVVECLPRKYYSLLKEKEEALKSNILSIDDLVNIKIFNRELDKAVCSLKRSDKKEYNNNPFDNLPYNSCEVYDEDFEEYDEWLYKKVEEAQKRTDSVKRTIKKKEDGSLFLDIQK